MDIPQNIIEQLADIGWSPARCVDSSRWEAVMSQDGLEIVPTAKCIMKSFGGLVISIRSPPDAECQPPVAYFDLQMPGGQADVSRIVDWQDRLGVRLNPIAELSNGQSVLVVASDGRIFGILDARIYLYGESFVDAIENVFLSGKKSPRLIGDLAKPNQPKTQ